MNPTAAADDLAIVVMSCDNYTDLWEPFAACFQRFWPKNGYPVTLVTDTVTSAPPFYKNVLPCGGGIPWTTRLYNALQQIPQPYVLLLLDDFLLNTAVNATALRCALQTAKEHDIGCVRLSEGNGLSGDYAMDSAYGYFARGKIYRIATVPGIWKREYLLNLTQVPRTAWDFERLASAESDRYPEEIIGCKCNLFPYAHAVKRGKWQKEGVELCESLGIPIDFSKRPMRSRLDVLRQAAIDFIYNLSPELSVKIMTWRKRH